MDDSVPDDDALLAFTNFRYEYGQQQQQQNPQHPQLQHLQQQTQRAQHSQIPLQQQQQQPQQLPVHLHAIPVNTAPTTAPHTPGPSMNAPLVSSSAMMPSGLALPPVSQHLPMHQQTMIGKPYIYSGTPLGISMTGYPPSPPAQRSRPTNMVVDPITGAYHQQLPPPHQQQQQPFSYIPSVASTIPLSTTTSALSSSRNPRRRKTASKRSLEDMILESNIPTNINTQGPAGSIMTHRQGPSIGLLTGSSNTMTGLSSPNMLAASGPSLPLTLPEPPLATAIPSNPHAWQSEPHSRPKKKSKYSTEQDALILQMKKDGKTWTEIAEVAKCGNSLAARNRYQVLIGQQGGGSVVWELEDSIGLKNMLEEGEKVKWDYIATELSRIRSKKITSESCRRKIKELFDENPAFFGVIVGVSPYPVNAQDIPYFPGGLMGVPPPTPGYGG